MNKMIRLHQTAKELLPPRDPKGHKGSFGKVLLYAGSYDMAGAAILSATAVLRTGAGMVKLWSPEENRIILQCSVPESLLRSLPAGMERKKDLQKKMRQDLEWADVIAAGCGIGKSSAAADTLRFLLEYEDTKRRIPYVLDADALNLIAERPELRKSLRKLCDRTDVILTPHAGELSRLYSHIISDTAVFTDSQESAKLSEHDARDPESVCLLEGDAKISEEAKIVSGYYNCIVAAKSCHTYVYSAMHEDIFVNDNSGNSGMATAGSGDVLTGMVASLLAQGLSPWEAAIRGVRLHALAGDHAASLRGEHGLIARDLLDSIGR